MMAKQLGFYFDASVCTGCKACMAACKDRSDLPVGVNWRRVVQYEGGSWDMITRRSPLLVPNGVFVYSLSVACNHCEAAPCVEGCPTGGMTKDENGIVTVDADKCVGCRYCQWLCPYDAPQYDADTGKVSKCDFCQDRLAEGLNPVCVDACPLRALHFGEIDELRARYGNEAEIEPLPPADIARPALVVKPHKHAQPSGEGTGRVLDLEEA